MAAGAQQAALLIDADNFADAKALEAAWEQLKFHAGRVSICRAYGAAMRLQALAEPLRNIGARPVANLPLDKNTTDAALMADAVALHFQQGVRLFAIASGDADFAPLAVRLREWGCEVWCFSINGILFKGAEAYYDRVVRFTPAVTTPAPVTAPVPAAIPKAIAAAVVSAVQPISTVSATPVDAAAIRVASEDGAMTDEVARILEMLPDLHKGPQLFSQAVSVLRQKMILSKTTKATAFIARHPAHFVLTKPNKSVLLHYLAPAPAPVITAPVYVAATKACVAATTPIPIPIPIPVLAPAPAPVPITTSVLSWSVTMPRRPAPPLLAELHGLRSVLSQMALRRISAADVLLAAPEMLKGQWCSLSAVAGRLREKGLLLSQQSALRVLERHPASFALQAERTPQAVRYLR
ncbi:MAG: NYN domain-containing protein [Giesbergeria sp.]|nr:NYN domain-containing protein [Giesbergeria sp.]